MEVSSWENHLFLWSIYTIAMLNYQRVVNGSIQKIIIIHQFPLLPGAAFNTERRDGWTGEAPLRRPLRDALRSSGDEKSCILTMFMFMHQQLCKTNSHRTLHISISVYTYTYYIYIMCNCIYNINIYTYILGHWGFQRPRRSSLEELS